MFIQHNAFGHNHTARVHVNYNVESITIRPNTTCIVSDGYQFGHSFIHIDGEILSIHAV